MNRRGPAGAGALAWLAAALVVAAGLSLLLGRYPTTTLLWPGRLAWDDMARRLVLNIRLPRVLAAVMTGMSLAAAGTVFQMLFGNPLVEPGFLGVSQGAAFGAALGIVWFGASAWVTQGAAALFALLGLGFSVLLARRASFGGWVLRLVLAGIAVSAFFSAGVGVLKYVADPLRQLADLTFWMLGGLSAVTWAKTIAIAPVVTVSLAVTVALRWRLNLLSLDDVTSFSLGAAPGRERALLLAAATAATASVVSVGGIVGWVGLIVPHLARRIFGADAARSLPGAALLGGIAVLACDDVARTVLAGELPLGILTSLLGAAAFVALLLSRGLQVQR